MTYVFYAPHLASPAVDKLQPSIVAGSTNDTNSEQRRDSNGISRSSSLMAQRGLGPSFPTAEQAMAGGKLFDGLPEDESDHGESKKAGG